MRDKRLRVRNGGVHGTYGGFLRDRRCAGQTVSVPFFIKAVIELIDIFEAIAEEILRIQEFSLLEPNYSILG